MIFVKDSIWWGGLGDGGAEGARRHAVLLRAHARTAAPELSAPKFFFCSFFSLKKTIIMPKSYDQEVIERKYIRKFYLPTIRRFGSNTMKSS